MSEHMRGFFKFPAADIETYTYATLGESFVEYKPMNNRIFAPHPER